MSATPTKEPTRDLVLEQGLAALGTGTAPEVDMQRIELYRQSRIRAQAEGRFMPSIPDDVFKAVKILSRNSGRDAIDPIVLVGYDARVILEAYDLGLVGYDALRL